MHDRMTKAFNSEISPVEKEGSWWYTFVFQSNKGLISILFI